RPDRKIRRRRGPLLDPLHHEPLAPPCGAGRTVYRAESETIMVNFHRMTSSLFGPRASPGPPPRPHHRSPRQRFTLETLEGRALLSYLTVSVPDNVVAETPFTMTATVLRDDLT